MGVIDSDRIKSKTSYSHVPVLKYCIVLNLSLSGIGDF
jgi:hypothetical protein